MKLKNKKMSDEVKGDDGIALSKNNIKTSDVVER
jgi:hypothetical protein